MSLVCSVLLLYRHGLLGHSVFNWITVLGIEAQERNTFFNPSMSTKIGGNKPLLIMLVLDLFLVNL